MIISYRLDKLRTNEVPNIGLKKVSGIQHLVGIKTGSYVGLTGAVIAGAGILLFIAAVAGSI